MLLSNRDTGDQRDRLLNWSLESGRILRVLVLAHRSAAVSSGIVGQGAKSLIGCTDEERQGQRGSLGRYLRESLRSPTHGPLPTAQLTIQRSVSA